MEISVTKSNVLKVSNNLKENAALLYKEVNIINNCINNLSTVWEGTDASSYSKVMLETYIPNLKELANIINSYGIYLEKVQEAYGLLDNTFALKKIE